MLRIIYRFKGGRLGREVLPRDQGERRVLELIAQGADTVISWPVEES